MTKRTVLEKLQAETKEAVAAEREDPRLHHLRRCTIQISRAVHGSDHHSLVIMCTRMRKMLDELIAEKASTRLLGKV